MYGAGSRVLVAAVMKAMARGLAGALCIGLLGETTSALAQVGPTNLSRAVKQAADAGDSSAQLAACVLAFAGAEGLSRLSDGRRYCGLAADNGNKQAQFLMGVMLDDGLGGSRNSDEALEWYRKAALQSHVEAALRLANLLAAGKAQRKDAEAVDWWTIGAQDGSAQAQFNLGLALWLGRGIGKDQSKARNYFQQAAKQALPEAQFNFAAAVFADPLAADQHLEVVRMVREAAGKGYAPAVRWAPILIAATSGDGASLAAARSELGRAALQGDAHAAEASLWLADMSSKGLGGPLDRAAYLRWLERAASLGHPVAQFNLGVALTSGDVKDPLKARKWYLEAANRGHLGAQHNLALLLLDEFDAGGVARVEAYQWLWAATALASEPVQKQLFKAALDEVEGRLSAGQVNVGQARGKDWVAGFQRRGR